MGHPETHLNMTLNLNLSQNGFGGLVRVCGTPKHELLGVWQICLGIQAVKTEPRTACAFLFQVGELS